jgi:hypothetical protein
MMLLILSTCDVAATAETPLQQVAEMRTAARLHARANLPIIMIWELTHWPLSYPDSLRQSFDLLSTAVLGK